MKKRLMGAVGLSLSLLSASQGITHNGGMVGDGYIPPDPQSMLGHVAIVGFNAEGESITTGSGTLVFNNQVITAGHVIADGQEQPVVFKMYDVEGNLVMTGHYGTSAFDVANFEKEDQAYISDFGVINVDPEKGYHNEEIKEFALQGGVEIGTLDTEMPYCTIKGAPQGIWTETNVSLTSTHDDSRLLDVDNIEKDMLDAGISGAGCVQNGKIVGISTMTNIHTEKFNAYNNAMERIANEHAEARGGAEVPNGFTRDIVYDTVRGRYDAQGQARQEAGLVGVMENYVDKEHSMNHKTGMPVFDNNSNLDGYSMTPQQDPIRVERHEIGNAIPIQEALLHMDLTGQPELEQMVGEYAEEHNITANNLGYEMIEPYSHDVDLDVSFEDDFDL